jgi:hypothetical protein
MNLDSGGYVPDSGSPCIVRQPHRYLVRPHKPSFEEVDYQVSSWHYLKASASPLKHSRTPASKASRDLRSTSIRPVDQFRSGRTMEHRN